MTARATDRQSEEHSACRIRAVSSVLNEIFFVDRATFIACDMTPIEPTRNALLNRRIRNEISRKLFNHELIKRHVRSVRIDDPVSIGPNRTTGVHVDARRVGVASRIKPRDRHTFCVSCAIGL